MRTKKKAKARRIRSKIYIICMKALKAQNENLVVVGMNEERLADALRQAISKGHEVLVLNYDPKRLRPGLKSVFHRRMTERIHAFVGLMGKFFLGNLYLKKKLNIILFFRYPDHETGSKSSRRWSRSYL